jgi:hypothetical protein
MNSPVVGSYPDKLSIRGVLYTTMEDESGAIESDGIEAVL